MDRNSVLYLMIQDVRRMAYKALRQERLTGAELNAIRIMVKHTTQSDPMVQLSFIPVSIQLFMAWAVGDVPKDDGDEELWAPYLGDFPMPMSA